ncbi:MAG TPA: autotransporter-associated beta strand repeat-containing protein [Chthoniobacter sp.]|nr:autotransporter-associated beta strand repeat-containing protein [Chthoniobacter sp.]
MKKRLALSLIGLSLFGLSPARADFLFSSFLVPSFDTTYNAWDLMYSPYNGANYPDYHGGFGIKQTATAAGFTAPANSNPSNPLAYWDTRNPTIMQTGTSTAFIVGPGATGNIYSFSAPLSYVLADPGASGPVGTVVFQFQTDGSLTNFDSIKLQYVDSTTHQVVSLSANEMIQEYHPSGSTFGGLMNRSALQWDLSNLGITSYQIVWNTVSASSSFQMGVLDTAATYAPVVPQARTWNGGTGSWSDSTKWLQGSSSNENGNVSFTNASAATVTLDSNRTVGKLTFNTAADTSITSTGATQSNFTFTANTGITTTAQATGNYTINAPYAMGAYNVFDINAGTVKLNGVVSGDYGLEKNGNGTLILSKNNTFSGFVSVTGGTLRLEGSNTYNLSTTVLFGSLIVVADAPATGTGALGNASSNVIVGADSATFAVVGGGSARLLIDGNRTIGRNITLANGTFDKTLGAQNSTTGSTYAGLIDLSTSTTAHLQAVSATDRVTFGGGITGGVAAGAVTIDGLGTVSFSGATKSFAYTGATNVNSGTLRIESGVNFTPTGNVSVAGGATLLVHGSLNGSGTLAINGGTLGGSGTVNRQFTLDAGDMLSPGTNVGTINTIDETWAGGGALKLEINGLTTAGSDAVNIAGALSLTANAGSKFKLQLQSLTALNAAGLLAGFNMNSNYSWRFLTTTTPIASFNANAFSIDTSGFQNVLNGSFNVSVATDGKGLQLNYLAIPEPSSALLSCAGAVFLLLRRRRRPSR